MLTFCLVLCVMLLAKPIACVQTISNSIETKLIPKPEYHVNATTGVMYSRIITQAIWKNNQWHMGEHMPAAAYQKGDFIWWPDSAGSMRVLEIEHHDVTNVASGKCCWSITIGIPHCEVKYCCGNGCCC